MSLSRELQAKSLRKKASRGFRGYPVATIAFYGPDDKRATKVAVGIVQEEKGEVTVSFLHDPEVAVAVSVILDLVATPVLFLGRLAANS